MSGRKGRAQEPDGGGSGPSADPETVGRLICLRLLTGSPRTRAQLAAAMAKRGVPDDAATSVLTRLAEVGLIDDRAFAAAWVSSRHAGRGLASRVLTQELRQRGVEPEISAQVVSVLDPDVERETARRIVRSRLARMSALTPDVAARRLYGLLARKGYPAGLAYGVVHEELAGRLPEDGDADPRVEG